MGCFLQSVLQLAVLDNRGCSCVFVVSKLKDSFVKPCATLLGLPTAFCHAGFFGRVVIVA